MFNKTANTFLAVVLLGLLVQTLVGEWKVALWCLVMFVVWAPVCLWFFRWRQRRNDDRSATAEIR